MVAAILLAGTGAAVAAPMRYAEFKANVVQPKGGRVIAYGSGPLQFGELWKPEGKGPFPAVLMIHGGCWRTSVARADIMHALAADLVGRGIAVWNVEYRGIDQPGGGYPGTFQDVGAAADLLAARAADWGIDPKRIVALGHSAGGHLALWVAGRHRIAAGGVLAPSWTLRLRGVVSQGGLPDLADPQVEAEVACGADTLDRLVGRPTMGRPDPLADTSPAELAPLGVPQRLFSGALDPIAPPRVAQAYADRVRLHGDTDVQTITVPAASHFELISPDTPAWALQVQAIETLLAQPRPR